MTTIAAIIASLSLAQSLTPSPASTNHGAISERSPRQVARSAGAALTSGGYGGIRIGTRPGAVRGYTLIDRYGRNHECYVASVKEVPDLALLVTDGVIKRISIGELSFSPLKTDRGIGIGSTQAAVLKTYRPISTRTHQYERTPSTYLTWLTTDGKSGIRFETGPDRKVRVIHVGLMPELGYVERCG